MISTDPTSSLPNHQTGARCRTSGGHRKATLDSLRVAKEAEAFSGLPEGVSHPRHLLDIFVEAAVPLGVPQPVVKLIEKLFTYTNPKDWQPGSRPIVWPSNDNLALSLGLSHDAITASIRQAVRFGYLAMKDSPNRQRFGKRDKQGRIVLAGSFGFDLSPLAIRYAEHKAAADKHKAEIRARADACRRISIARAAIAQAIEAADESGVWSPGWDQIETRLEGIGIPRRFAALSLKEASHLADRLAALHGDAKALFAVAVENPIPSISCDPKITGMPGEISEPKNNTTPNSCSKPVPAIRNQSSGEASAQEQLQGQGDSLKTPLQPPLHVKPNELLEVCPALQAVVFDPQPTWADLGAACADMTGRYAISKQTWQAARKELGILNAIIAFAILTTIPEERFTRGPGAYFGGMLKAAARGELNLLGSYFGMTQRAREGRNRPAVPPKRPNDDNTLPRGMHGLGQAIDHAIQQQALNSAQPVAPTGRVRWQDLIRD
jgi:replication initiation protein RepC